MINYYILEIKGKNVRKFLHTMMKQGINLYSVKYRKDSIILKVSYEDYKKIKSIKTTYEVNILRTSGKKFIADLINKYKVSILVFIISIFFILFLSSLILYINIETDDKSIRNSIEEELHNNGITLYSFKNSYSSLKDISKSIKDNNLDKIEWIEFDQKGVVLKIKVIERKNNKNKINNDYKDIVASRNGYIRKIYSGSGELLKNIDDYVKKGEVIISGNIFRNGEVVGRTKAEGKVYAEVWYIVKEEKSAYYNDVIEEKYGVKRLILRINNHNIRFISIPKQVDMNKKVILFQNDLFKLFIEDKKRYKLDKLVYKREELQKVLETKAKKEIEKKLKKDEYIISQKTLKTEYKNGKMYIEVFFRVYEDIAEEKDIAQIEKKEDE